MADAPYDQLGRIFKLSIAFGKIFQQNSLQILPFCCFSFAKNNFMCYIVRKYF